MAIHESLTNTEWSKQESAIRRFEEAWRREKRPDPREFIPETASDPTRIFTELVHIDLEFRIRSHEEVRIEEYFERYPSLCNPKVMIDLIVTEYFLRFRNGQKISPEDYFLRFPQFRNDLKDVLVDQQNAPITLSPFLRSTQIPVSIAGYEIDGELGRGGMGVVYQAHQSALNRIVAIKTLAVAPGREATDRFRREAESIARLDHPSIVPIYEIGEWNPGEGWVIPYFVMKWYPGGNLDKAHSGKGTDPKAHAETVKTIALAIHHAHLRGILHRDLKPSNILLDENGTPHVADFGLASRLETEDSTNTPGVVGTPAYMAPEQALGTSQITTAADIYGLGTILYQLLSGRPPFIAPTPLATVELVANSAPQRPSSVNPNVPRDLEIICLKCLEKEPSRRYASADLLAEDLGNWLSGKPIQARPTSILEQLWMWSVRHPLMAFMILLTLGALVALIDNHRRLIIKEKETHDSLIREKEARHDLSVIFDREQVSIYREKVSFAGRLYAANQLNSAWRLLDETPCSLHRWEWRYLDSLRRSSQVVLKGHKGWVTGTAFLPDGRLVSADHSGYLIVWDLKTKKKLDEWYLGKTSIAMLSAHPNRNWLLIAAGNGVTVWDMDTKKEIRRIPAVNWGAFSPDGKTIAAKKPGCDIGLWDADDGKEILVMKGHKSDVIRGSFSSDSKKLVSCSDDRTIRIWDLTTGKQSGPTLERPLPIRNVVFTRDGKGLIELRSHGAVAIDLGSERIESQFNDNIGRGSLSRVTKENYIAINGRNSEVMVWDLTRDRLLFTFRGHTSYPSTLTFSPDEKYLVSGSGDKTVRLWDLTAIWECRTIPIDYELRPEIEVSPNGKRIAVTYREGSKDPKMIVRILRTEDGKLIRDVSDKRLPKFHPDGKRLVAVDGSGQISLMDLDSGAIERTFPGLAVEPSRIAISPDGKSLAAGYHDGQVRFWDLESGQVQRTIQTDIGVISVIRFSPDLKQVALAGTTKVATFDLSKDLQESIITKSEEVADLCYFPDSSKLVTVGRDGEAFARDAKTGETLSSFSGHSNRVTGVSINRDGTRLVTSGYDGTVRIWDTESGIELLSLPGLQDSVARVFWDTEADRIIAQDRSIRIWEAMPDFEEPGETK